MESLYLISEKYREAMDYLSDPENDIDAQTIADTMESLDDEMVVKLCNVARAVKNMESMASAIREAERSMASRRSILQSKAEHLREYMLVSMQKTGIDKAFAPDIECKLAKNPPSVEVFDEAEIPQEFWREKTEYLIDKARIKAAGGCPGARVVTDAMRVSIK